MISIPAALAWSFLVALGAALTAAFSWGVAYSKLRSTVDQLSRALDRAHERLDHQGERQADLKERVSVIAAELGIRVGTPVQGVPFVHFPDEPPPAGEGKKKP